MMIPRIAFLALMLAACAGDAPKQSNVAYYDMPGIAADLPAPLRSLDVVPASWLAGNAMYYRLAYADGNRREHFAESRWTAQPAELLSIRLQRSFMSSKDNTAQPVAVQPCRLRVDLDDLVQVFDSQSASRLVLEGRATLIGQQQTVLARRTLGLSQPSGTDARSGAVASGPLLDALARELQSWVNQNCKKSG